MRMTRREYTIIGTIRAAARLPFTSQSLSAWPGATSERRRVGQKDVELGRKTSSWAERRRVGRKDVELVGKTFGRLCDGTQEESFPFHRMPFHFTSASLRKSRSCSVSAAKVALGALRN